jgi:nucleotide-binding universal stress UspA family protein
MSGRPRQILEEDPMFETVLVPVDLTPKNRRAVQIARDLARDMDSEVLLIHVIETLDLPFEELEDFYERLQRKAMAQLEPLIEILSAAEVSVSSHIVFGKRAERVLTFAEENSVDLMVLDSHRVRPDQPGKGLGTLSYQMAILARCPVLLVKGADD